MKILWLLLCLFTNTIVRWQYDIRSYDKGQALSFLFLLCAYKVKKEGEKEKQISQVILDFLWLSVINNVYDEIFGDPLHFGWNEWVTLIIGLIWTFYRSWTIYNTPNKKTRWISNMNS